MKDSKEENQIFFAQKNQRKDDLYLDIAKSKENWRRICFIVAAYAILLSGAFIYRSFQAKYQPFIVKVNEMGKAVAFGPAEPLKQADERLLRAELYEWLTNIRSIYGNRQLLQKQMNNAFALVSSEVSKWLNKYFSISEHDPRNLISNYTRTVDIRSIIPIDQTTGKWKLRWVETLIPKSGGRAVKRQAWEAYITVKLQPQTTTKSILKNPLGVYITELNWSKISPLTDVN